MGTQTLAMQPGGSTGGEISLVVVNGVADEFAIVFSPGLPVAPFTVGARAHWRVRALAVQDVHLFLAFNGSRLFGAAASRAASAWVDGVALPASTWTELPRTGELVFGTARIRFGRAPDPRASKAGENGVGSRTLVMQRPPQSFSDANCPTLIAPFDPVRLELLPPGGAPHGPPGDRPTVVGSLVDSRPGPVSETRPPPRADELFMAMRKLRALPPQRIAILLLAILSIGAAVVAAARIRHPAQHTPPGQVASSSPKPVRPPTTPIEADAAGVTEAPSSSPSAPIESAVAGTSTLERDAVDALARGTFTQAAAIYDRLIQAHPGDPRFREAARLARRRIARAEGR
jgi:hypothetical protein